ncbi:MAG: gliding motility-associated C-terminal domain-containing protein [Flavobacteriales bacterium]|nr:gliding motility-associated C-terminal domain-containing protein [Flavobacteriales bacterium]
MKRIFFVLYIVLVASITDAQTYFLNGNAQAIGNDCYQLTGEFSNQNGTVWYADQIDLNEPFDIQFLMNFGTLDGTGADGICFVLQTVGTSAIGASGGGLGYLNFGTSLGIEFDTWLNGEYGDPVEDHIAIEMNGVIDHNSTSNIAGPVQADPLDANIEDGDDHVVRIIWSPDDHIITVYFDCVFRLAGTIDLINEIFNGQELVYWGFTAATGGSWNNQTVCLQEDILNVGQDIDVCEGGSVLLTAGASADGVYNWTPTSGLDDPASATPTASPDADTQYQVEFLDLCNQPVTLTFNLNVEPLVVTVSDPGIINCINNTVSVTADINFNIDGNYTWSQNANIVEQGENITEVNLSDDGTYIVAVSAMDGCYADETFTVQSDFSTYTANAGNDMLITCLEDSPTIIGSTNGSNAVVAWEYNSNPAPGLTGLEIEVTNAGTYTLVVINPSSGCSTTDDVLVQNYFVTPIVNIGEQDSLTCVYPQIQILNVDITAENNFTLSWTTEDGLIVSGASSLHPFVASEGFYELVATDDVSGCSSEETVFIGESDDFELDLSSITFPNIITPNGDSKNEYWRPFLRQNPSADLSSVFTTYDLLVFDKWGRQVFDSNSFNDAWKGNDNSDGVYYYILNYSAYCGGGKSGVVEGNVTLLR